MSVTGTNISLTLRNVKGSELTYSELDGNQSSLKTGIENHSHNEFAAGDHNHALSNLTEKSYNSLTDKPTIPSISGLLDETAHDALDHTGLTGILALGTTSATACAGNDARLSDSRPASDVSAWAKSATKPTYTYTEVGTDPAGTAAGLISTHASSNDHDGRYYTETETNSLLSNKQNTSEKGQALGYCPLDGSAKVAEAYLPDSVLGQVDYQGTWNATTNTPIIPAASTANKGWYYIVATSGTTTVDGISEWTIGDWIISNGTTWNKVDNTDSVSSVFGRAGAIIANSGDYTASQITNVPVGNISATTVQAAINELDTEKASTADSRFVTNGDSHDHVGGDGAAISLTAAVSGILPVANGGTGSTAQNFVDLTTDQTIAGNKTLTGTTTIPLGSAAAPSLTFAGDTDTGVFSAGAGSVAVSTNGTKRVEVIGTGEVGIGSIPVASAEKLQVTGNTKLIGDLTVTGTTTLGGASAQPSTSLCASEGIGVSSATYPVLQLKNTTAPADKKYVRSYINAAGGFGIERVNEAYSATTAILQLGATNNLNLFAGGYLSVVLANIGTSSNYFQLNASNGGTPITFVAGANSDVAIGMSSKGTGNHYFYTNNGNQAQFQITHNANAVNRTHTFGGPTGIGPSFYVTGTDANITQYFSSLGTSPIVFLTQQAYEQFRINNITSAVNFLSVQGAAAGNPPCLCAEGSDANIDIPLIPKGSGRVRGTMLSFACERSSLPTVGQLFAFGNGAATGLGAVMPFAGKLVAVGISGLAVTGTLVADAYVNEVANTSYQISVTGTGANAKAHTVFTTPLAFTAGTSLNWQVSTAPTAGTSFVLTFFVVFD